SLVPGGVRGSAMTDASSTGSLSPSLAPAQSPGPSQRGLARPRAWANLGLVSGEQRDRARAQARDSVALAAAPFLTRGVELDALLVAIVDTIVDRLAAARGTLYLVDGR